MRHSVTWPNSRWWLAACDWLMSPLCRTIDTIRYIVRNVTNIWEWSSCTELRTETWKFCKQLCVFYGEWPLMVKFSKFCSESLHGDTDRRCCVQMSQNFSDAKLRYLQPKFFCQVNKLFTWQKNKISVASQTVPTARIAPKICQGQPPTMYSEYVRFHPNRLTFGVIRPKTAWNRFFSS